MVMDRIGIRTGSGYFVPVGQNNHIRITVMPIYIQLKYTVIGLRAESNPICKVVAVGPIALTGKGSYLTIVAAIDAFLDFVTNYIFFGNKPS